MTDDQPTLSLQQAIAAQSKLREVLGLPEERFPLPAFIGMISDEVEQLLAGGLSHTDIARIIAEATGIRIDPVDIDATTLRRKSEDDRRYEPKAQLAPYRPQQNFVATCYELDPGLFEGQRS